MGPCFSDTPAEESNYNKKNPLVLHKSHWLLVCGYMRSTLNDMNSDNNHNTHHHRMNLPPEILFILFSFYQSCINIFLLKGGGYSWDNSSATQTVGIECINLNFRDQKFKTIKFNILNINISESDEMEYDMDHNNKKSSNYVVTLEDKQWDNKRADIIYLKRNFTSSSSSSSSSARSSTHSFSLPIHYSDAIATKLRHRSYETIIKCGGLNYNECSAIVFDENLFRQLYSNYESGFKLVEKMNAYQITLPSMPYHCPFAVAYSTSSRSLFALGDENALDIFQLSFNTPLEEKLQWQCLSCRLPANRGDGSALCVINEQMLVCGGSAGTNPYMYNFASEKYYPVANLILRRRSYAGILYENTAEKVYMAGGALQCKIVEEFDLTKNTWLRCGTTRSSHEYKPFLFHSDAWPHCIFIAGDARDRIGTVEMYDRRTDVWRAARPSMQLHNFVAWSMRAGPDLRKFF